MNEMQQVLDIAKRAAIPVEVVAREALKVSRATVYNWCESGVPENRLKELQALHQTLCYYIENDILPLPHSKLIWYGIVHATTCVNNIRTDHDEPKPDGTSPSVFGAAASKG